MNNDETLICTIRGNRWCIAKASNGQVVGYILQELESLIPLGNNMFKGVTKDGYVNIYGKNGNFIRRIY